MIEMIFSIVITFAIIFILLRLDWMSDEIKLNKKQSEINDKEIWRLYKRLERVEMTIIKLDKTGTFGKYLREDLKERGFKFEVGE